MKRSLLRSRKGSRSRFRIQAVHEQGDRDMARVKKEVVRRCCGCGAMKDRQEMIRVIRDGEGQILIDDTHRLNGRGAYLCRSLSCLETALRRRGLERTLKSGVDRSIYELLKEKIDR